MTSKPFSIIDALKFGFSALWENILQVGLVFIGGIIALGVLNVVTWLIFLIFYTVKSDPNTMNIYPVLMFFLFVFFLIFLASFAFNMVIGRIALDAYDKKKTELRPLLSVFGIYLLATTLFYWLTFFGLILFIIPGVIWYFKYYFVDLIVIDTGMGFVDAFKRSNELTYGHKWYLLAEYLLMNLLILVSIVTIIGPVVLVLVNMFSRAYIYRKLVEAHNKDISQFTAVPANM